MRDYRLGGGAKPDWLFDKFCDGEDKGWLLKFYRSFLEITDSNKSSS